MELICSERAISAPVPDQKIPEEHAAKMSEVSDIISWAASKSEKKLNGTISSYEVFGFNGNGDEEQEDMRVRE